MCPVICSKYVFQFDIVHSIRSSFDLNYLAVQRILSIFQPLPLSVKLFGSSACLLGESHPGELNHQVFSLFVAPIDVNDGLTFYTHSKDLEAR